ncbi:tol-pal system protein YbgF [Ancylobacter oerskovii]|uniref:Cell division coordinator CpoB n=1 Tax=Ancylobacter oerskovii TaxID=459519 RepID=A0ABW4YSZ2_9HYPH|nr:tol-pal system protein YbgF [Ancylobacter oerskovii]MBS7545234.1 tol-pal system protein YbgF [Ancylobacter oerskovii]
MTLFAARLPAARLSVALACAALLMAVPAADTAFAQADNNFFGNIFRPPGQVRPNNQPAQPAEAPDDATTVRVDRIENQLRQMTGMIEQLQYRNQQLEAQVRHLQEQLDMRMGGGGGGAPARAPTPDASGPAAPSSQPGRRSDAFDPSQQPAAPGAPRPLGTGPSAASSGGAPMDLGTLSGAVAGGGGPSATLPPSNSPKDLYELGVGYMQRQDYALASQTFKSFVQQYPNDRLLPDVYFGLGEADYSRQSYKEAAQSFLKVSADYPNAVKAPDALLRLGQSLAAIGEKDAACATLNAVNNKYPRASASVKQGVEREQKRAGC